MKVGVRVLLAVGVDVGRRVNVRVGVRVGVNKFGGWVKPRAKTPKPLPS